MEKDELYLVPVKEYSGNGSGKLPGNVRNVRGDDCDGLQGPHCQLLHQHSHDNGQQVLDLKRSKQDCTGSYISCGNIGNNTRRGHNIGTSSGSVKRMIERYEMLGGGRRKQELNLAPRKEYSFGSSGTHGLEETLPESPAKRQKRFHPHPLPPAPSSPGSSPGPWTEATRPPPSSAQCTTATRSPGPRWRRIRPATRLRASLMSEGYPPRKDNLLGRSPGKTYLSRWTGLALRGRAPASPSSPLSPPKSSTLGSCSPTESF